MGEQTTWPTKASGTIFFPFGKNCNLLSENMPRCQNQVGKDSRDIERASAQRYNRVTMSFTKESAVPKAPTDPQPRKPKP
jgi:hypothetical protein